MLPFLLVVIVARKTTVRDEMNLSLYKNISKILFLLLKIMWTILSTILFHSLFLVCHNVTIPAFTKNIRAFIFEIKTDSVMRIQDFSHLTSPLLPENVITSMEMKKLRVLDNRAHIFEFSYPWALRHYRADSLEVPTHSQRTSFHQGKQNSVGSTSSILMKVIWWWQHGTAQRRATRAGYGMSAGTE